MERPLDYNENNPLILEQDGKLALKTASRWAKFVAIFGLVLCSLALIGSLLSLSGLGSYAGVNPIVMVLYFGVLIMACVWVLQFARKASSAINESNSNDLTESLRYLRNLFILQGVISILVFIVMIGVIFFAVAWASNI